jgi:hypothetical protein
MFCYKTRAHWLSSIRGSVQCSRNSLRGLRLAGYCRWRNHSHAPNRAQLRYQATGLDGCRANSRVFITMVHAGFGAKLSEFFIPWSPFQYSRQYSSYSLRSKNRAFAVGTTLQAPPLRNAHCTQLAGKPMEAPCHLACTSSDISCLSWGLRSGRTCSMCRHDGLGWASSA